MDEIYELRANPRVLAWLFKVINENGKWRKMTNAENKRFKIDLNWLIIFEYYDFQIKLLEENIYEIKLPDSKWFKTKIEGGSIEDRALRGLFEVAYGELNPEEPTLEDPINF